MKTKQELSTVLYAQPLNDQAGNQPLAFEILCFQHQTKPERVSSCRNSNALATNAT